MKAMLLKQMRVQAQLLESANQWEQADALRSRAMAIVARYSEEERSAEKFQNIWNAARKAAES